MVSITTFFFLVQAFKENNSKSILENLKGKKKALFKRYLSHRKDKAPSCLDDNRLTKKVRIRHKIDHLAPDGEVETEQNADENMGEASDMNLTQNLRMGTKRPATITEWASMKAETK